MGSVPSDTKYTLFYLSSGYGPTPPACLICYLFFSTVIPLSSSLSPTLNMTMDSLFSFKKFDGSDYLGWSCSVHNLLNSKNLSAKINIK
jgi:hypothetical protein